MAKHRIALIGGDGIGPEVVGEAVRVLRALSRAGRGPSFAFTSFPWGSDFYHKTGRMCPANYLDLLRPFDAILLGAVGRPDIPDHVTLNQLLLPIRRGFDLYVNARPIVLYEGLESPLKGWKAGDTNCTISANSGSFTSARTPGFTLPMNRSRSMAMLL